MKGATSPFQYALSTRAGCECIAHALQALTELDPAATVLSVDGIGASDLVSRKAMMQGLFNVSPSAVPFVRQYHGRPSRYLREDDTGVVHDLCQGEGGEQGDPMMPPLFSLGQHNALVAMQARLREGERIFGFLDDVHIVTSPDRVSAIHAILHSCGDTHRFEPMTARPRCGTGRVIAPQVAMFWTELPVPLILSSPQCGEEKESQSTKAFGFLGRLGTC